MLNIYLMVLKLLYEVENKLAYQFLRVVRGTLGYARDATLSDIQILHDSPHYIVVNKHQDVVINHLEKDERVTVERQLERLYPDLVNPKLPVSFYFCHRLDYSTSGILCIAKHKKACAEAAQAFAKRNSEKYYLAILRGHVSRDYLTITEGIGDDKRERFRSIRMATASSPFCTAKWRNATTHLAVLEKGYCYDYPATKVLLKPITGRRHQLRLHCSHIGHTIVGDYTYSNRKDMAPYRMFLHAYKLLLPNKIETLDITTPDPFSHNDARNQWTPQEHICDLDSAVGLLRRGFADVYSNVSEDLNALGNVER